MRGKMLTVIYSDRWKVECPMCETINRICDAEVSSGVATCGCCKEMFAVKTVNDLALEACEEVMKAIAGHTDWHPSHHVDTPDWNEDAHIEVTLTVKDCRLLKRVLYYVGKMDASGEWVEETK